MKTDAEFELALRQQLVLARSAALRESLADHARALGPPLAAADRARAVAAWLYARRVWIGAAAVVVLVMKPRRAWRVARMGWWVLRNGRRMLAWLAVAGLIAQRS